MRPRAVALIGLGLLALAALVDLSPGLRRVWGWRYRLTTGCEPFDRAVDLVLLRELG